MRRVEKKNAREKYARLVFQRIENKLAKIRRYSREYPMIIVWRVRPWSELIAVSWCCFHCGLRCEAMINRLMLRENEANKNPYWIKCCSPSSSSVLSASVSSVQVSLRFRIDACSAVKLFRYELISRAIWIANLNADGKASRFVVTIFVKDILKKLCSTIFRINILHFRIRRCLVNIFETNYATMM